MVYMRKNRILKNGARYHVSVRVNNKEMLLRTTAAKKLFVALLKKAKKRYEFSIENYVIMGNHVHLLIVPGIDENLSRIMQWVLSIFAITYNKRFNRSGHFWGERFFSRVIESFFDYLNTFGYIDRNPIVAGVIDDICDWKFSGVYEHRNGRNSLLPRLPNHLSWFFPYHNRLCLPESLECTECFIHRLGHGV